MDFSKRQADPRRHLVGITFVILFHAFIVYALVTGLAKKVVEVVRAPIETKVIEEVKKPPPPAEVVVPPPPRLEAPPPPYIPPPEVQIATPPPPQPTITAVTPVPPPAPVAIAPIAPPVVAPPAPPPAAAPPAPSVGVTCPGYRNVLLEKGFPREAMKAGIEKGETKVGFTVTPTGQVKDVEVLSSSNRAFNRGSVEAVQQFTCKGQDKDIRVTVVLSFILQ